MKLVSSVLSLHMIKFQLISTTVKNVLFYQLDCYIYLKQNLLV